MVNEEFTIEPSIRSRAAAEACQYLYPKLKALEHSGDIKHSGDSGPQVVITIPSNDFNGPQNTVEVNGKK